MFQSGCWKGATDRNPATPVRNEFFQAIAVVPVHNEAGTIGEVVRELRSVPEIGMVVVVDNGSTDGTAEIARRAGAKILRYPERVGYDVARALGVKAFRASAYLFMDGDIVVPAAELRPFVEAVAGGVDLALNDLERYLSERAKLHSVNVAKRLLNLALGRPDLGCNSLTAVPHALSEKAVKVLGCHTLAVPPVAHALAIQKGLVVKAVCAVDVTGTNRIHLGTSLVDYLADVIIGDHLEAISQLLDSRGRRAGFHDGFRRRELVFPTPRIMEPEESPDQGRDEAAAAHGDTQGAAAQESPPPEAPEGSASDFKRGFDQGYDRGFDAGADAAWEVGFEDCISMIIPDRIPLPLGCSLEDIVARGAEALRGEGHQPMAVSPWDAFCRVKTALSTGRRFSLVRVGDREICFLAHGVTAPLERSSLASTGEEQPKAADQRILAEAISRADLLGLPICHQFEHQSLFFRTMPYYGIDPFALRCTDSTVIYVWQVRGYLRSLLLTGSRPPRVLLVGNEAPALEPVLRREGVAVTGTISPVKGIRDAPRTLGRIASETFDLALVAAGTAAVLICPVIAGEMGKVAIDIGDLADHLARGIRRL